MSQSLRQELIGLRKKKTAHTEANRKAKEVGKDFKQAQAKVIERMKREETESLKTGGTLFSLNEPTIYATIEDRSEFVRWALENSQPIEDFIARYRDENEPYSYVLQDLISAIHETSFVQLKEHADPLNALVRQSLDDGQVLPPGVGFRTDEYISQRSA